MAKILLVGDADQLGGSLQQFLAAQKHHVEVVDRSAEAVDRLRFYHYDLLILDWILSEGSGLDVCRHFRNAGGTAPVLMMTEKNDVMKMAAGLDAGADDCLARPFHAKELHARIRALLRRSAVFCPDIFRWRNVVMDTGGHTVSKDGRAVNLSPREFSLLELLMRHRGQVCSPRMIINHLWPDDSDVSPEAVRIYVCRIRSKLDGIDQPSIVDTVHGVGYKLGDAPPLALFDGAMKLVGRSARATRSS